MEASGVGVGGSVGVEEEPVSVGVSAGGVEEEVPVGAPPLLELFCELLF